MDKYLFSYAAPSDPPVKRGIIRLVERATGQPELKRLYVHNQRYPRAHESFWQAAVRSLALDVRYDAAALARGVSAWKRPCRSSRKFAKRSACPC